LRTCESIVASFSCFRIQQLGSVRAENRTAAGRGRTLGRLHVFIRESSGRFPSPQSSTVACRKYSRSQPCDCERRDAARYATMRNAIHNPPICYCTYDPVQYGTHTQSPTFSFIEQVLSNTVVSCRLWRRSGERTAFSCMWPRSANVTLAHLTGRSSRVQYGVPTAIHPLSRHAFVECRLHTRRPPWLARAREMKHPWPCAPLRVMD